MLYESYTLNKMSSSAISAKHSLEKILSPQQIKNYYHLLVQSFVFFAPISNTEFCNKLNQILTTPEQFYRHNWLMRTLMRVPRSTFRIVHVGTSNSNEEVLNQLVKSFKYRVSDFSYVASDFSLNNTSAESPLSDSTPYSNLFRSKIAVSVWNNGLRGMNKDAINILWQSCHVLIKDITVEMLSRRINYKLHNGHFQHSFGSPTSDSFIKNDKDTRDRGEISDENDDFVFTSDALLPPLAYDLELLYQTFRESPNIVPYSSLHNLYLLKMAAQLNN